MGGSLSPEPHPECFSPFGIQTHYKKFWIANCILECNWLFNRELQTANCILKTNCPPSDSQYVCSIWTSRISRTKLRSKPNTMKPPILRNETVLSLQLYGLSGLFLLPHQKKVYRQRTQFCIKATELHNNIIRPSKWRPLSMFQIKSTYCYSNFARSSDFFIKYLSRTNILENCQFHPFFLHVNINGERSFSNIDCTTAKKAVDRLIKTPTPYI